MKDHHKRVPDKNKFKNKNLFLLGVASLFWLIFRTGTKPSRIVYPCQQAALANNSMLLTVFIPLSVTTVLTETKKFFSKKGTALAMLIIVTSVVVSSEQFWGSLQLGEAASSQQEIQLTFEPRNATAFPASDIYVVNGRDRAHVSNLIEVLAWGGLDFYSLIGVNDVVIIKINEEWPQRGGTNTDVIKEVIQAIVDHPDGFTGEIVVADNGQWGGSMDHGSENNAEDHSQSTQDVVDMFSGTYDVSTFDWRPFWRTQVDEFSAGDLNDGYILYPEADPVTTERVSYPKFTSDYGTHISGKYGIWNGSSYDKSHLKLINLPVLKCHDHYGFSGAIKHYLGFQAESYSGGLPGSNGHLSMRYGGMGYLMKETIFPTLNIIDAIWISAIPGYEVNWPQQSLYSEATRVNVLAASTDPVALDYWAAKHILLQAATILDHPHRHTVDPDSTNSTGLSQVAPGIWLPRTRDVLTDAGYNVTTDENRMNVYVHSESVHDIAVAYAIPSKTVVAEGHSLNITTMLENQGDFNEEFNLTIYTNTTAVQTKTVALPSKGSTAITFAWNTTGFAKGNYTIKAVADIVPNETDTNDNTYADEWVIISMIGDITGPDGWPDGKCDMRDVALVATKFSIIYPDPRYDPNCDVVHDRKINMRDVGLVARQFGKADP